MLDITVYTACRNEEKMLPYFLMHYSTFCKRIVVYDNESTDSSVDIVNKWKGCKTYVKSFSTNGKFDESVLTKLRSNFQRFCETRYAIVVDCDEFLYHKDIVGFLNNNKFSFYNTVGYDMISEKFPDDILTPLTNQIKSGVMNEKYSKCVLFDVTDVSSMNYSYGSHECNPTPKIGKTLKPYTGYDLKLLHYKELGLDGVIERHRFRNSVMSLHSIENGLGYEDEKSLIDRFNFGLKNAIKVIE
jgi:hypothetical protein